MLFIGSTQEVRIQRNKNKCGKLASRKKVNRGFLFIGHKILFGKLKKELDALNVIELYNQKQVINFILQNNSIFYVLNYFKDNSKRKNTKWSSNLNFI